MKRREILFCGDLHGQFRQVLATAARLRPMAVVLLGDIEATHPLHVALAPIRDILWWIGGNHDTDRPESWSNLVDSALNERRLDGRVVTLPDGTRLAGLGGVFRDQIWRPPGTALHQSYGQWLASLQAGEDMLAMRALRDKQDQLAPTMATQRLTQRLTQHLTHRSSVFPDDYLRLAAQQADILVTHEAGASHPHGFDAIDELASAMGVGTAFHGHQHDRLDYSARWPQLGFRAFGVGLRGITGRDGEVIVPGELDQARAGRGETP